MSFNFINDFCTNIYKILSDSSDICLKVERIYLSVVQDAKYPFLLINILRVDNFSKFDLHIYEVEFEICIFSRDKNQGSLTNLANLIEERLKTEDCSFKQYAVAGINVNSVSFKQGQDLATSKLTMHYKALIKQEI